MFVQVIQGHVTDPNKAHEAFDKWAKELAPTADGWLGTTAGVTDDGHLIAVARFSSAADARRNSDRPEQDQWWTAFSKNFSGEATFQDSTEVDLDMPGEPDRAGFVQVMQGRTTDPARARQIMQEQDNTELWAQFRPEVLGTMNIGLPDGEWVMAIYFTSEAEARKGEKTEPPAAIKAQMAEMDKLSAGEPTFHDLKKPWLYSPR